METLFPKIIKALKLDQDKIIYLAIFSIRQKSC